MSLNLFRKNADSVADSYRKVDREEDTTSSAPGAESHSGARRQAETSISRPYLLLNDQNEENISCRTKFRMKDMQVSLDA